jgi:alkanesulfonate monooxygenase SsuD/methylene tetrahydromethanopterin reductase-like flavin-dependent oxidoreductase (luciferase family)
MQIGGAYPTTQVAGDPDAIRKFCLAAEDLGYSHLMAYDHAVKCPHEGREPKLTGPYTDKDTFNDPFVLFGFAAAITSKLGTTPASCIRWSNIQPTARDC